MKTRRQFIRTFSLGTVTGLGATPWLATFLATVVSEHEARAAEEGELILQLSSFPPLLQPFGSVRVSVNPIEGPFPTGSFYPIIITRGPGNIFYAVSSSCTHRGCVVTAFDGSAIVCPCHGSEFTLDGTVTKEPANSDLLTYPVVFDGLNTLRIRIPELGYSITQCRLEAGPTPRLSLEFPTFDQVQYEVRFHQTSTAPWNVVPYATTLNGPVNNFVLNGDGLSKTIFVERTAPAGFFAVAMILKEV
jgi:Rieske Fe-S protein